MKDQYKAGLGLFMVLTFCIGATENEHFQKSSTTTNVQSPTTCSGDIYLSSQAQVDAFPSTYGCTEITGTLTISGNDITNLDSLHFLTKVDGDLFIDSNPNLNDVTGLSSLTYVGIGGSGPYPGAHITYNPKLTNLDGLNNLTTLGGLLEISNNNTLTNLDGLSSLQSLGAPFPSYSTLLITNNPALISLHGLRSITTLDGSFTLSNNSALPNLDGLESLSSIAGVHAENSWLRITDNASLSNIDGLSALTDVTGKYVGISIANNPSLLNLNGLSSLKQIAGTTAVLEISNNISLPNVNGLSSLKKIGSGSLSANLTISNNTALTNVDGLSSLTEIRGTNSYLTVTGNTQLAKCCGLYNALKDMTSSNCFCNPHISISGNGAGCNQDDILAGGPCPVVCNGTIVLRSQAEVNAFPSTHPCNEIAGSLYVSGDDITNVDSLHFVTKITGLLEISYNATLTNLDGLSSLQSIGAIGDPYPVNTSLIITNNPALISLNGLRSITSLSGNVTITYNSSLPNLHGLESLTKIEDLQGEGGWLKITDNASLSNIDALSALTEVNGEYVGISIVNNPSLLNLNGLSSLRQITGSFVVFEISSNTSLSNVDGLSSLKKIGSGVSASLIIKDNTALTNVDGLSSLTQIRGTNASSLTVTGNTQLAKCCGLYNVLNDMTSSSCSCNPSITISGNGAGCTKDEILTGGPCCDGCTSTGPESQPTNMIFSAVTDTTMTVSFTAASPAPSGYITLMQAFGAPYPDDAPVDGTTYQPGDVIGSSTIVVNVGSETSLDIIYLSPGIDYYFDTFSYTISNGVYDYLAVNPLEGDQWTTSSSGSPSARRASNYIAKSTTTSTEISNDSRRVPFPNPFSENTTFPFTTSKQNVFVQIAIYDLTGKKITDVVNDNFDPGYHEAKWWGTDNFGSKVSNGIYIYRIRTDESKNEIRGLVVAK